MQHAVIWDLDGTLVDSYKMIVPSLREFYAARGLLLDEGEILRAVLTRSVREFADEIEQTRGVSLWAEFDDYQSIRAEKERTPVLMPHAKEVLEALQSRGVPSFLYTHRGASTELLLAHTGIAGCFVEILTAQSGFPRKPAPDAIDFLVEKHRLDRAGTCYIGDRKLDMDCARNAGIVAVLFRPADAPAPPADADHVIETLPALLALFP